MVGGLTFRGYTREEVGRMTWRDFVLLHSEPQKAPPEATTPQGMAAAVKGRKAAALARMDSWEPD